MIGLITGIVLLMVLVSCGVMIEAHAAPEQSEEPYCRISVVFDNWTDMLSGRSLCVTLLQNGTGVTHTAVRPGRLHTGAWTVPPGIYDVQVECEGASPQVKKGLVCGADREIAVHFGQFVG
jgi:hypothetical protein